MAENDKETFMREAIRLAVDNVTSAAGGPFGAVIVHDGQILARGTNLVTATNDPTAHAEVRAIREACEALGNYSLSGCEIYCSCEPCPMCLGAIYWARLETIYFAATKNDAAAIEFDDHFIYEEIERPIAERKLRAEPLLREEALQAFKLWISSTDNIAY